MIIIIVMKIHLLIHFSPAVHLLDEVSSSISTMVVVHVSGFAWRDALDVFIFSYSEQNDRLCLDDHNHCIIFGGDCSSAVGVHVLSNDWRSGSFALLQ